MKDPLFDLGQTVATQTLMSVLENRDQQDLVQSLLHRHVYGDWGDVSDEDWRENEQALKGGARLMSVYKVDDNLTIWIITEHDRSATTVMLPWDY